MSGPLQAKKGNAFANTILYAELCAQLEIDAEFINIPKQCIIAFYSSDWDDTEVYLIRKNIFNSMLKEPRDMLFHKRIWTNIF